MSPPKAPRRAVRKETKAMKMKARIPAFLLALALTAQPALASGSKKSSGKGSYTAEKSLAEGEALENVTLTATDTDESAVIADGVTAACTGCTFLKKDGGASSADGASFYGVNSAVYALNGADLTLSGCTVVSSASNATGVFAYNGGVIRISDSTVTVSGGGSGGIQVAGGGILYAENLTVESSGKAAIRSDRGGGTLVAEGGTYLSTGSSGAPAVYSTADITVKNALLTATNSRAVIIEGKNSVSLENCVLSGNGVSSKAGAVSANVLLYQSMSGDAEEGTSVFEMTGGSMKGEAGAMFYVTNTSAVIRLEKADLTNLGDGGLITVSAGRWGKDGANGGRCVFEAKEQVLEGDITVDGISSLSLTLTSSSLTGAVTAEEGGEVRITLEEGSTWTLTGDSRITSLDGDLDAVDTAGYALYVGGERVK